VCVVDGDAGINLFGNGSDRLPYIPAWLQWNLVGQDSDQANVTVTGSGTSGDPWVVTVDTEGGAIVQTIYLSDDTWIKPSGTVAQVVVIGGGGGGGTTPNYPSAAGGSGGSGGAMSVAWFPLDDLPDDVDVVVGQGGAGGRPISGLTTGGDGGRSDFGAYLFAPGGKGGKSQSSASQTQFTTDGGTPPEGGPGGAGSVRDGAGSLPPEGFRNYLSPNGGGMGGGDTVSATSGASGFATAWAGDGGDGGDPFAVGPDDDGQPGGLYGGGGGGGASSIGGPWYGGDGGQGVVVVTVW
jgi:hypothetical protein